jgi:hypothetical protein
VIFAEIEKKMNEYQVRDCEIMIKKIDEGEVGMMNQMRVPCVK